ncbi:unnamed protein product [Kuraishia capsulata CBS 1993]|uniref:Xylulose kinase n=1 Tax=Kuraishia capsulata CBS 1993 TaxID=1382522 RepID=W6MU70_9ASCO|nr:uncharacterized protein KUCA_T00001440001 [Kuraishia capsulata CBS 1993]CDK25470.1 unnamed protein product [Kuraishia capsulata CBS 1993]
MSELQSKTSDLFLGFDLSTQQLKVISAYANLSAHKTYRVDFDADLPHYGVHKGVHSNEETGEIYAPVEMWIEALDLVFTRMKEDGFPFADVRGMSGSCQQHGSVYWSEKAESLLNNLSASKPLKDQLCPEALTFLNSPNWQDHSTGPELEIFEDSVGGPDALAEITGSRAHYRFTGTQIRKLATRVDKDLYRQTARISLISSFLSSLLAGTITKIEEADGCGMNIYDISKSAYDPQLLAVTAGVHPKYDGSSAEETASGVADLQKKLGDLEPIGPHPVGTVSSYFVEKYGFNANAQIFSFTGDNLATILALPLANNDILVSMGTSTTVLLVTDQYVPSANYHIFKHPTIPGSFMGMLCYCNGSLARELIRDEVNHKFGEPKNSWTKFDSLLDSAKPLGGGSAKKLGVYFPKGEIIPNCSAQTRRYTYTDSLVEVDATDNNSEWTAEDDVAAIVEGQALSCRLRAGPMLASTTADERSGDETKHDEMIAEILSKYGEIGSDGKAQDAKALSSRPNKCFYVGGASKNVSIVSKFASILGPLNGNFKADLSDACALGGCYKAIWSQETNLAKESGVSCLGYNEFLSKGYDWDNNVEKLNVKEEWDDYIDGVGILSSIEKTLRH